MTSRGSRGTSAGWEGGGFISILNFKSRNWPLPPGLGGGKEAEGDVSLKIPPSTPLRPPNDSFSFMRVK